MRQLFLCRGKLWCCLVALVAVLGVALTPETAPAQKATGNKWALLIGVNDYEDAAIRDLRFAVPDVKATADSLIKYGKFDPSRVVLMTSDLDPKDGLYPSHKNVYKKLRELADVVQPEDTLFFYFSGHGFQYSAGHFLATANAEIGDGDEIQMENTSVSMANLNRRLQEIKARQVVFVLDACRNDPLKGSGGDASKAVSVIRTGLVQSSKDLVMARRQMEIETASDGTTIILLATGEGQTAWEMEEEKHGVFTYFLLQGLKGKAVDINGNVTALSLGTFVRDQVKEWTKTKRPNQREQWQLPMSKLEGYDFTIASFEPPKEEPTPTTPPNKTLLRVVSAPPGAAVFVKGFDSGLVTPCDVEVDLPMPSAVMDVELQMDGYKSTKKKVTVKKGTATPLDAELMREAPLPQPLPTPVFIPTAAPTPVAIPTVIVNPTPVVPVIKPTPVVPVVKPTPVVPVVQPTVKPTPVTPVLVNPTPVVPVVKPTPVVPVVKPTPVVPVVQPTVRPTPVVQPTPEPLNPNAYQFAWKYLSGQRDTDTFAMSANGLFLVTAQDENVVLWDARSGRITMFEHSGPVRAVAINSGGNLLAAVSANGQIRIWKTSSDAPQKTIEAGEAVNCLAITPDGSTLAGGTASGTVKLWDVASGKARETAGRHQGAVLAVAFAPDGSTLASGGEDKTPQIWNTTSGALQKSLGAQEGPVTALAYSPDGGSVAAAVRLKTAVKKFSVWTSPIGFREIKWHNNGSGLVTDVRLFNLATNRSFSFKQSSVQVNGLSFSPEGRWLMSRSDNDRVYLMNMQSQNGFNRFDKVRFQ